MLNILEQIYELIIGYVYQIFLACTYKYLLLVFTSDCFLMDEGIPQNHPRIIQRTMITIISDDREAMRDTLTRNLDLTSRGPMNPTSH